MKNAQGTVAFPCHSCAGVDALYDVDGYCDDLLQLPELFHPIKVCLHIHDIKSGLATRFIERGFEVVSAGDQMAADFPKKFYELLSACKYATSNVVGSYTFYSIELGLPFFITGKLPRMKNHGGDPNVPAEYTITDLSIGKNSQRLFSTGPNRKITEEQRRFVMEELGVEDCISREKLAKTLVSAKIRESYRLFHRITLWAKRKWFKALDAIYKWQFELRKFDKIFTHMTSEEKICLHKLLSRHFGSRDVICVEIGSYLGASSCFIASAISSKSTLYCVDTWENHHMQYCDSDTDATTRDTFYEFERNTETFRKKITATRKWSADAFVDISSAVKEIDFLFIDGDHNYSGVKADWESYSSLLRPGSIVVFHDTGWAEGVQRVIVDSVKPRHKLLAEMPNMQAYMIESPSHS